MILKYWACAYSALFGLFLAGIALVLLISGSSNYRFTQMPYWEGATELYGLLIIGALGVAAAILALVKGIRPLLLIWTLAVFFLLIYGYFISPKHYFARGESEAWNALYLSLGALIAFLGALLQYRKERR